MTLNVLKRKNSLRIKRKKRIRSNINGTQKCPRISIFRSNKTIYVQAIEDINSTTICASSGKVLGLKANVEGAKMLAKDFAQKLKDKNIDCGVFDRNGYIFHGIVAAFANALRENGIKL